ncbi:uncharacterized protein si:ch1073-145m9.1 isoform X2 [Antennarius striatus]|uniref:uncharacterized protein si:ch1073-145m9.1 isoform X2 n=1 Tax=Antennarius striatus TaxID=241820 RepID=UPI0035AF00CF
MGRDVLLDWPNVIGYVRIGCVFAAWASYHTPEVFVCLYGTNIVLDGVDGWLARRLGRSSRFGAWLDVVVDNLGRGMLWSLLYQWGWLVSALEWCVFVCNHGNSFTSIPPLVRAINGFWTPLGVWVMGGLHALPLWLYWCHWGSPAPPIQILGTLLLGAGRLLALTAELWCVWTHIQYLTSPPTAPPE